MYDQVGEEEAAENPLFKEIVESQLAVRRAGGQVGSGHRSQPPHGLQPLLRPSRARQQKELGLRDLAKHHSSHRLAGWCFVL